MEDHHEMPKSHRDHSTDEMRVTQEIAFYLKKSAMWSKILSIVGIIVLVLVMIMGIIYLITLAPVSIIGSTFSFLLYACMTILGFLPLLYLYRFSKRSERALSVRDEQLLANGLKNLRSYFKFLVILMAIIIVFYFFMMLGLLSFIGQDLGTM